MPQGPCSSDEATRVIQVQADAQLQLLFGSSFKGFVDQTKPDYVWYRHCLHLADVLDRVERGELKRVMIWFPPQDGKSELTSRQFPAYSIFKNPKRKIISTSYAADLAFQFSRDARDNYLKTGNKLRDDSSSKNNWVTPEGGGLLAAGVGGPITGSGGDILIVDDPIKNKEEAYSIAVQEGQWGWYRTTFYTRRRPGAAIIIIMTRWVTNDLCGRLLEAEKKDPTEHWHIVCFPAVAAPVQEIPPSCTLEPEWRSIGEPLCPERRDIVELNRTRKVVGEETWQAMYQQNPVADAGNIWKLPWFQPYDDSIFNRNGQSVELSDDGCDWDTAYGDDKEENAASAFVRAAIGNDGSIYVSDCGFEWFDFPRQLKWMQEFDAPHYVEAKASGKSIVQALSKAGVYAMEVQVRGGDKIARTKIVTPIVEQGKVFIHRSIWDKLLLDDRQGILAFPARPFKDLNDAFVQMLNRLWPYTTEPKEELTPEAQVYHDYLASLAEEMQVNVEEDWRNVD
jgi:hypothetical protein